jgi:hypothetical protein
MTTALIPLDTLGAEIKARIAAGDKAMDKAEQHYIAAGIQLAAAKDRVKQTPGLTWPRFLNEHCNIRRARADELIMIADGRTTLADLRMKKAESVRAVRQRQKGDLPLRSGESVPAITEAVASRNMYSECDPEVGDLNAEISRLKEENRELNELLLKKRTECSDMARFFGPDLMQLFYRALGVKNYAKHEHGVGFADILDAAAHGGVELPITADQFLSDMMRAAGYQASEAGSDAEESVPDFIPAFLKKEIAADAA